jgi:hypothetical protein
LTHRAETLIAKVTEVVTGLSTTSDRVYRGRAYPLGKDQDPALLVYQGADEPQSLHSQTLLDSLLTVRVEARVRSASDQLDTLLNRIREEVTVALQADYLQGLTFVLDTLEGEAAEPEFSTDGEQPLGRQVMTWKFLYRRNRTNPGA